MESWGEGSVQPHCFCKGGYRVQVEVMQFVQGGGGQRNQVSPLLVQGSFMYLFKKIAQSYIQA